MNSIDITALLSIMPLMDTQKFNEEVKVRSAFIQEILSKLER